MTLTVTSQVAVEDGDLLIRDLRISNADAAALVAAAADTGGPAAATELVRRALPLGLIALSLSSATVDTSGVQRTLASFHELVDARSRVAVESLDNALRQFQDGDAAVASVARQALEQLPRQIDGVLAGEAGHVREAVKEAALSVQATGLEEIRTALAQHSRAMRDTLSLDRDGPVQTLRRDLLTQLEGTRRELSEQLAAVRGLLQAAEAARAAAPRSTRASGDDWEDRVNRLMSALTDGAGDRYAAVGATPAPGGTRRPGDGLVTLSSAISGATRDVRLLVEAKLRARPLNADQWRRELTSSCQMRGASGALALVPSTDQVPGNGPLCRVSDFMFVVSAEDPDTVRLVYLLLREIVALLGLRQHDAEIDLSAAEAHIKVALNSLSQLDEVGRLCQSAQSSLTKLLDVGRAVRTTIERALTNSLETLNP